MSRILLNNSNAVLQAVTACNKAQPSPTVKNHVVRRWQSLLFHMNKKHHQAATTRNNIMDGVCSDVITANNNRCFSSAAREQPKCLQLENINPNFITMEYAVRGPLVIRAGEIEKELKQVKMYRYISLYKAMTAI